MPQSKPRARLFVGQLNFGATEDDIRAIFDFYGHVLSVNLLHDKSKNRSKGSAFVEYGSTGEADCAIRSLHNRYYMERDKPLQVSYCERSELISPFGWQQALQLHQENSANPPPPDRALPAPAKRLL
uniref:Putative RNA binding protein n=1 Tax=Trypanosoma cruzi TaxID=5693 RepID=A0A024A2L4_TRYCR|nr:putative RNA binding protein [Trypanosoma cruzi]